MSIPVLDTDPTPSKRDRDEKKKNVPIAAARLCGCHSEEANVFSDIYTCDAVAVSRSLCELPSDESYMSCRNCSPMTSDTFESGVTSEESVSLNYNIAIESESDQMKELVYKGSVVESRNELIVPIGDKHWAKIDNPKRGKKEEGRGAKDVGSNRCDN